MQINQWKDFDYGTIEVTEPYCKNSFEKEKNYLMSLDCDRFLAGFLETAGRIPKKIRYSGWEVTEIQGHTLGHYLTALSQAYAATKDVCFGDRIDYLCRELKGCQREDGYLFAWREEIFDRVENHQPAWVPWYTMHKILSGLITAYRLAGNRDAYDTADLLGDWIFGRTDKWTEEVRMQVLSVEYGGMNDALYDLYQLTGKEKHRAAAHKFDEEELFRHLYEGRDVLDGLHANTTIPKILGAVNRYLVTGERFYLTAAMNFWEIVTGHHSYITGGNSEWEHFGKPDMLDSERTACNCETCNIHNMLRLSKRLFEITGNKKYMDYYETAWLNSIMASQNPETGMAMYFQPMATGFFKVFHKPDSQFWCCTGTGMENFTKLSEGIFFTNGKDFYIARYVGAKLTAPEAGIQAEMDAADFLETGLVEIRVSEMGTENGKLYLRVPQWSTKCVKLQIDGREVKAGITDGFLCIDAVPGMFITVEFSMEVEAHTLPDNPNCAAFTYGPAVLCGKLGTEQMETTETGVSVTVPTKRCQVRDYLILNDEEPEKWLEEISQNLVKKKGAVSFSLKGTNWDDSLEFVPYFSQYKERFGIYWPLYREGSAALDQRREEDLEQGRTEKEAVDVIPIGNDQYELAHEVKGLHTTAAELNGIKYREASEGGWFSYKIGVNPEGCFLAVTYRREDAGSRFEIQADGRIMVQEALAEEREEWYTKYYPLTRDYLQGREQIRITFRPEKGSLCRIYKRLYVCTDRI